MNHEIPVKVRYLAALMHLVCIVFVTTFIPIFFVDANQAGINARIFISGAAGLFVVNIALWLVKKDIDPFFDQCARNVVNCMLNYLIVIILSLLFMIFVVLSTCGVGFLAVSQIGLQGIKYVNMDFFKTSIDLFRGFLAFSILTYSLHSLAAGISAIKGYLFCSRFIFRFIGNT
jgi:uncharacterized Tic20 family protein